jgi:DNA-binding winged helix-turn-helix (wHTH) protein
MASQSQSPRVVRFGVFELDLRARELLKRGVRLRIHDQPFQVLVALAERPGEVVTREELRQRLWPGDTFVDFDHSINTAVNKLRETLGDSAETPRFIETIARRGYRFVAPVETVTVAPSTAASGSAGMGPVGEVPGRPSKTRSLVWAGSIAALLAASTAGVWLSRSRKEMPAAPLVAVPLTTYPGLAMTPSFSPDGTQVAFTWCREGYGKNCHIYIKQIGIDQPFQLTADPAADGDPAWSPDGQTIAFVRSVNSTTLALVLAPQRGGRERVLERFDTSRQKGALWDPWWPGLRIRNGSSVLFQPNSDPSHCSCFRWRRAKNGD